MSTIRIVRATDRGTTPTYSTYNNMAERREYYHRHLRHWQPGDAIFFVTFRLKGSLPRAVIEALHSERERERLARRNLSEIERAKQDYLDERSYFGTWDATLDKADFGPRWLSQREIAEIVRDALQYRDGQVYNLYAFSILPNHVHAVFEPLQRGSESQADPQTPPLHQIMQSLKRHTARRANILLGREGAFWQDETYDHVVRDNGEFLRIIHYVVQNPVTAGLVSRWEDWPRTYCEAGLL